LIGALLVAALVASAPADTVDSLRAARRATVLDTLGRARAAVGTGDIDFKRIFAAANVSGMKHFFVENDAAPQTASSLADIETSYRNLRQLLA